MKKRNIYLIIFFGLFFAINVKALSIDEKTFIHGNIEFILLHELAHIIINDLEIPVFGPEELAADYLATIALINPGIVSVGYADQTRQYLSAVAKGFSSTWDLNQPQTNQLPFWDSHGLTIQRYYNVGCLLYGSNPDAFAGIPSLTGLPEKRAEQCVMEFKKAEKSAMWLLENYGKKYIKDNTEINIIYSEPQTEISREVQSYIRDSKLIENISLRFNNRFYLPNKIDIKLKGCRARQAIWKAGSRELIVCHELFDYFYSLSRISGGNNLNQPPK